MNAGLEATITTKIEEVKERLAGLLARNAMDTAVLYLLETRSWSEEERRSWRKAAVEHVRGRLTELRPDALRSEEIAALKGQLQDLNGKVHARENAMKLADQRHSAETEKLKRELREVQQAVYWYRQLTEYLESEWESGSFLSRRKPFRHMVTEFSGNNPRPREA